MISGVIFIYMVEDAEDSSTLPQTSSLGGISRGLYLLLTMPINYFIWLPIDVSKFGLYDCLLFLTAAGLSLLLAILRLYNIGVSRWWALIWGLPIVEYFFAIFCVAYPAGYAKTGKKDKFTYIIIGLSVVSLPYYFGLNDFIIKMTE